MPPQDADIILIERFLNYFSGMFGIADMLKLPIVAKLEVFCRFIHVFIQDLDVILLSRYSLDPDGVICARKEKQSLNRMYA